MRIAIENATEFTSKALDRWAYERKVILHFITLGQPMENGYIESFHGKFLQECLNEDWFLTPRRCTGQIIEAGGSTTTGYVRAAPCATGRRRSSQPVARKFHSQTQTRALSLARTNRRDAAQPISHNEKSSAARKY